MSKIARLALIVGLLLAATAAEAQTVIQPTGGTETEQRQRLQEQQVSQGVAAGAIDAREAARLGAALERVQRAQERAYADGVLTLREQRGLERAQVRLQRHIDRALSR